MAEQIPYAVAASLIEIEKMAYEIEKMTLFIVCRGTAHATNRPTLALVIFHCSADELHIYPVHGLTV
jgi:hypothetical protein